MPSALLDIRSLSVSTHGQEIIHDVSLSVEPGETHLLMGPNGSGKTTLLSALMGDPRCTITGGSIFFHGSDVTEMAPEQRAALGMFLSFQHPPEIPGVTLPSFARAAVNVLAEKRGEQHVAPAPFLASFKDQLAAVDLEMEQANRGVNEGYSGGEKKKAELLQLLMLRPSLALLDEIDSGLDIDATARVLDLLIRYQKQTNAGILLVSHNPRLLELMSPQRISIMVEGKIAATGGREIGEKIGREGFTSYEQH